MKQISRFLREARGELNKVTWPKREQVFRLTLVVVATSVVMGLYLGALDYAFQKLLEISL